MAGQSHGTANARGVLELSRVIFLAHPRKASGLGSGARGATGDGGPASTAQAPLRFRPTRSFPARAGEAETNLFVLSTERAITKGSSFPDPLAHPLEGLETLGKGHSSRQPNRDCARRHQPTQRPEEPFFWRQSRSRPTSAANENYSWASEPIWSRPFIVTVGVRLP